MLIPPPELRTGIGPFDDPDRFLRSGLDTVQRAIEWALLAPSDAVLDVGCGCGRLALPLMQFLSLEGRYTGFDPDRDGIAWCQDNIAASDNRFEFIHVDLASDAYNPVGIQSPSTFDFPSARPFDFAILSSVITHLYPDETANYLRNLQRVLGEGGRAFISGLIMDEAAHEAVTRETTIFDFRHKVGKTCWTFDPGRPLDGIACDKDWLLETLAQCDLELLSIHEGNWRRVRSYEIEHDWISVRKPGQASL